MSILVLGSEGNMGRRYTSILNYLGRHSIGIDKGSTPEHIKEVASRSDGVIIATPTDTHLEYIKLLMDLGKPILTEKPITKSIPDLKDLFMALKRHNTPFRMIQQYEILCQPTRIGKTHYNYYRHGSDGMVWDCIQIIGLSRSPVHLAETSPVWSCMINGQALNIQHMDAAYIAYIQKWFQYPKQNLEKLLETHEKTAEMAKVGTHG